jgi:mannose-6-phosphate isomerase class I
MLAVEKRKQYYEYLNEENDANIDAQRKTHKQPKTLSTKQKAKLIFATSLLGALCVMIIVTTAYISQIKYNINRIESDVIGLEKDIQNIQIDIQKSKEINQLEAKAIQNLGMIYPSADQIVFLSTVKVDDVDFGAILKEQAFN